MSEAVGFITLAIWGVGMVVVSAILHNTRHAELNALRIQSALMEIALAIDAKRAKPLQEASK